VLFKFQQQEKNVVNKNIQKAETIVHEWEKTKKNTKE
jgi:hypothetical protein